MKSVAVLGAGLQDCCIALAGPAAASRSVFTTAARR